MTFFFFDPSSLISADAGMKNSFAIDRLDNIHHNQTEALRTTLLVSRWQHLGINYNSRVEAIV
jgi:hypothetical protein